MEPFRTAGQVFEAVRKNPALTKFIPFLGDLYQGYVEVTNPTEPKLGQRLLNAAVVGGGGALASAATGGIDQYIAIPDIIGTVGKGLGLPENPDYDKAAAANVEHYLREAAYHLGGMGEAVGLPYLTGEMPAEDAKLKNLREKYNYGGGSTSTAGRPMTLILPTR